MSDVPPIDTDNDTCDDCSSGSFDPANDGADFDGDGACDAGDTDDDKCIDCSAGKYAAESGQSSCTICTAGFYSSGKATLCSNCTEGKYSAAEATTCTDCSVGYYNRELGATACLACGAGSYASSEGSTACTTSVFFTTSANAEGAIEGLPQMYEMASPSMLQMHQSLTHALKQI